MVNGRPLQGVTVLVTRPEPKAGELAASLQKAGARVLIYPAIEIQRLNPPALRATLATAGEADWLIFVSPNAAEHGLAALRAAKHVPARWPRVAAVGESTARILAERGVPDTLTPREGTDSEALLAEPPLQAVAGKRIIIFRGQGGRELLADTLRERGATVDYAECYRREPPSADPVPIQRALARGEADVAVITSVNGLENLLESLGADALRALPVVTVSARVADALRREGFRHQAVVAPSPSTQGLTRGVIGWHQ